MTKLLMKVFNARQMVGKFAKGAMLAACFGMMMSVAGVASAYWIYDDNGDYFNSTNNFKITTAEGASPGTLDLNDNITVSGTITGGSLSLTGNNASLNVNTDKFTVNNAGNTTVGGTLGVTGKATFSGGIDAGNKNIGNVLEGGITENSTNAVNGKEVYTELQKKVDAGTAGGTNAIAVGATANASGANSIAQGYYAKAEGEFAVAIGSTAKALKEGTTAVGPGATADEVEGVALGRDTRVLQGATNSVALGFGSVATESDVVSVGVGDYTGEGWNENAPKTRKIVNVQAGTDDNDAATVGQIKAVDGTYVKEGQTVAENFTALDSAIGTWAEGNYIKTYTGNVEKNNKLGEGDDPGSSSLGSVGENLMALDKGLTEEVTRAQKAEKELQDAIDTERVERINADKELRNEINQTNDRVDRVGATAAALAAINYQPMSKGQSQVAVGMGGYKGKKATAIGMAYQITDRVSGSVAGAANGSEHMFNVGFNYLFGQHTNKDVAQCAAAPGSMSLKEAEMQSTIDSQGAKINSLEAEIAELKAMVKALATK